jgi:L-serine dehydratase
MEKRSILNYVIGPIMRGPSSSHTAASYFIGKLVGNFVNYQIENAKIIFNEGSSWAQVFRMQNSEYGFIAGLINFDWFQEDFYQLKEKILSQNISVDFVIQPFPEANHPNYVIIELTSTSHPPIIIHAKSTGGGTILLTKFNEWDIDINGENYYLLIQYRNEQKEPLFQYLNQFFKGKNYFLSQNHKEWNFIQVTSNTQINKDLVNHLLQMNQNNQVNLKFHQINPIVHVIQGEPLFRNSQELLELVKKNPLTLGNIGLHYEAQLLGLSQNEILKETEKRLNIMLASVETGLNKEKSNMKILKHSASQIYHKFQKNALFINNINTKCALYALATMDVASSGGMICAAPTGGSAGVLPAILYTLSKEFELKTKQLCLCLLAAGVIGLINSYRSTFAAEIAGCQVEIGMAGAMGCAAVIEAAHGTTENALNAAAISLQNTMGSVCDLVAGLCEIPCHTRNATVASNAFVCADLILGGYINPIPLDETLDASLETGMMLPRELRCTALGGIANTKTAKKLFKDLEKS